MPMLSIDWKKIKHPKLLVAMLVLLSATGVFGEDRENYEVHQWAVWILDSTLETANAQKRYPSAFPRVVKSSRSRKGIGREKGVSPLGMMFFYGEPVQDLEIGLRVHKGRFVASWPTTKQKSKRLRWLDINLKSEREENDHQAMVSSSHWFTHARKVPNTRHVSVGNRIEKFIAYDHELNYKIPLRLEITSDQYQLINLTDTLIRNILISVPTREGRRIGWLDRLPSQKRVLKTNSSKASDSPGPKEEKETVKKKSDTKDLGSYNQGKPVVVAMSESLDIHSEAFQQKAVQSFRNRLLATGLAESEVDLILKIYGTSFFESEELVIVFQVPEETVEKWVPFESFPEPQKRVRTTLALVRNIDPNFAGKVEALIVSLGDPDYKTRQRAEDQLAEFGTTAIASLKKAVKHKDLEVVFRAERLLKRLGEKFEPK